MTFSLTSPLSLIKLPNKKINRTRIFPRFQQVTGKVSRGGAEVRALASLQCGPGSIPRSGVNCGLSLLVLYSAPRGFSSGTPVFTSIYYYILLTYFLFDEKLICNLEML